MRNRSHSRVDFTFIAKNPPAILIASGVLMKLAEKVGWVTGLSEWAFWLVVSGVVLQVWWLMTRRR